MTSIRFTRTELGALIDRRRRADAMEGQGEGAYMDFWFRITPELLYDLMGARIVHLDGSETILDGVVVGEAGYVEPILRKVEPSHA